MDPFTAIITGLTSIILALIARRAEKKHDRKKLNKSLDDLINEGDATLPK